ncbi:hypothetical protein jhhlp_004771 [Lomentospora prolificans]|uniref:Heterokaryon incompatibility domain-containing protein n=1 Tax=Lomentospora prolificans TaxID=41688 RepID=A0A2N3N8G3_9PEZI|nr:hypothetical protein jhhlp_004771 [Lomentospora prolificans]
MTPRFHVSLFRSPGSKSSSVLLNSMPVGYDIPESTRSDASLEWVTEQLELCDSSHAACAAQGPTTLPKRVLDIGTTENDIIRLYTTKREPDRYVCLSHCWGTHPILKTLSNNLRKHEKEISWADLPKTFQEAIEFTRRLSVKYIWIDSLCIIQDDNEDWREQGSEMADIYAKAYLTIAAAHSRDSRTGLYSTVSPEYNVETLDLSSLSISLGDTDRVYACRKVSHVGRRIIGSVYEQYPVDDDLPLLHRGWVFQERHLSRRVLFFTSQELSWECVESMACQCRGQSAQVSGTERALGVRGASLAGFKRLMRESIDATDGSMKSQAMHTWLTMVKDYTSLQLTYEKDVFPALSGLARQMGKLIGTTYVAGLWDEFLLIGLCWHPDVRTTGGAQLGLRPSIWRAPSWSWASIKTPIDVIKDTRLRDTCQIVSFDYELAGSDPMGELRFTHSVYDGAQAIICSGGKADLEYVRPGVYEREDG